MLMSHSPAYKQLLTLIGARSQQWLRFRIEQFPTEARLDHDHLDDLAEIAVAAYICTGLRGTAAPVETFLRGHFTPDFVGIFLSSLGRGRARTSRGTAMFRILTPEDRAGIELWQPLSLADRLALSDRLDAPLLAEAQAFLKAPVPEEQLTEGVIDTYARVLALCYRFGAERPRFADSRTYGDAYANCLRFADWAQRKGRLTPLAQLCFCLRLIDPDHDVSPMLADIVASQRPDGSFPVQVGFGTGDQDREALAPTLAALVAVHMAVYRQWRRPQPTLPLAA